MIDDESIDFIAPIACILVFLPIPTIDSRKEMRNLEMFEDDIFLAAFTAGILHFILNITFPRADFYFHTMSLAKVYRDVNLIRPVSYWDYNSLDIPWG